MYAAHFGLSAPPFQLNPDPSFLFESKGHNYAHQYLRYGAMQGEGFIIVTGEIGAGKTTLVRALLNELDPTKVAAAQIVSTQLEADDLLRAVANAFGVPSKNASKAELLAAIEAHFTTLMLQNRRALLVIDEAQNLNPAAIEELRMLSNFQYGNRALLQSYLVGQPELREVLRAPNLEQLRQRIIASCHIGPMDADETRAYIIHRLKRVGWTGRPQFDDAAFATIHDWTGGLPRRINMLCNRLLLSAFLDNIEQIDATRVDTVAREIREEIGGLMRPADPVEPHAPTITAPVHTPAPAAKPNAPPSQAPQGLAELPILRDVAEAMTRAPAPPKPGEPGPLICIAQTQEDRIALHPLMQKMKVYVGLPAPLLVGLEHLATSAVANDPALAEIDLALLPDAQEEQPGLAVWTNWLDQIFETYRPTAVLTFSHGDAALAAALMAKRRRLSHMHIESGLRHGDRADPQEIDRILIDQLTDLHLTLDPGGADLLTHDGIAPESIRVVGNLRIDATLGAIAQAPDPKQFAPDIGVPKTYLSNAQGYALLVLEDAEWSASREKMIDMLANAKRLSRILPVIWPMPAATHSRMLQYGLSNALRGARVACVPERPYGQTLALLRQATCLLTDRANLQDASSHLGIPCLTLQDHCARTHTLRQGSNQVVGRDFRRIFQAMGDILEGDRKARPNPFNCDGKASDRIAQALETWLMTQWENQVLETLETHA
ncbi:XrtA/PEP-CTERM system-associated ATPase [Thiomonas bhubaneswarensis]|uniref:Putative secretion ATPase, PEP-CTERM locus subfamily n=1 Tax=Thiomonas bhubaneswarensis TaxID=339866 RepID=A0A0K6I5G0_9BURK|nr:XrtA/PEP-CTERM system-associated ATPase [Thiomonas bhubaneswarensis]CUA98527.1 putative secretion ATPase, PEP-CTERM locus subfamily [Thiomonas bhubaneswarensis]